MRDVRDGIARRNGHPVNRGVRAYEHRPPHERRRRGAGRLIASLKFGQFFIFLFHIPQTVSFIIFPAFSLINPPPQQQEDAHEYYVKLVDALASAEVKANGRPQVGCSPGSNLAKSSTVMATQLEEPPARLSCIYTF